MSDMVRKAGFYVWGKLRGPTKTTAKKRGQNTEICCPPRNSDAVKWDSASGKGEERTENICECNYSSPLIPPLISSHYVANSDVKR